MPPEARAPLLAGGAGSVDRGGDEPGVAVLLGGPAANGCRGGVGAGISEHRSVAAEDGEGCDGAWGAGGHGAAFAPAAARSARGPRSTSWITPSKRISM